MRPSLQDHLQQWQAAGLLGADQAEAIRRFEAGRQGGAGRMQWPIVLALAFGALLLGAGMLLFVAANWAQMSPSARFLAVLGNVLAWHLAGALSAPRLPRLGTALHGLGTLALGAGVFLAGQIFNLQEHWPGGVLLWALGAWLGCALLRDWVQAALAALLTPLWLAGEWIEATRAGDWRMLDGAERILTVGLLGLALTYLSARRRDDAGLVRRALVWVGGLALIPAVCAAVLIDPGHGSRPYGLSPGLAVLGWALALGGPLALALALRRGQVWANAAALVWALALGWLGRGSWTVYAWCALGAIGLAAWGLQEERRERVNLGVAGFALTVLAFYFSAVMDKLGRSIGLMGLGILFLVGGWQLERLRRRMTARIGGGAA